MAAAPIRTLILEDDPDHAELLTLELGRIAGLEFDACCFHNADDALRALEDEAFDLAIVDYWLGTETSERFLEWLKAHDIQLPIVVTTSANDEYVAASVTRAGAHRYLRKQDLPSPILSQSIQQAMLANRCHKQQLDKRNEARQRLAGLTPREKQVAQLITQGLLSKQIAAQLGCAEGTVNLHRSHIMAKTGAQSVADLVRMHLLAHPEESLAGSEG